MARQTSTAASMNTRRRRSRPMRLFVLALSAALQAGTSRAYVTSHGALPPHRQREWLKTMTNTICQVEPGSLSKTQISQTKDLMYASSHLSRGGQESALAVEALVKRMIDERRAGQLDAELDVEDYNCLLEGWARSGLGVAAAERCEQILSAMQEQGPKPNLDSFKATLLAWKLSPASTVSFSPLRMQRILEWMIRLYQEEHEQGNATGNGSGVLPDADCFDMVLQVWSRSGLEGAPQKTEHLLGVMERLHRSTGLSCVKPRTASFNAVLAAWSKARSSDHDEISKCAHRAYDVFSFMELLESHGDTAVSPDNASYNMVMNALAKLPDASTAALKTDAFLSRVEGRYYEQISRQDSKKNRKSSDADDLPSPPDTILFNTAMGCLAKSNIPGAYRRARSILGRQTSLYDKSGNSPNCKPDVYGYTSVITSCAGATGDAKEKRSAFDIALTTFRELQSTATNGAADKKSKNSNGGPNHVTYGAMLKGCAKLLPAGSPRRTKWACRIFRDCCEAGYVGEMVTSRLREAVAPDVYHDLLQGHHRRELPKEWTRNVDESTDHTRRKAGNKSRSKQRRRRAEV